MFSIYQVIRPFYMTDRLVVKLKEKENVLHCVYLNDFNLVIAAFVLQCNEAKNWYDGFNKARHIYIKLKQDLDAHSMKVMPQQHVATNNCSVADSISFKKSPLGSSIGDTFSLSHTPTLSLTQCQYFRFAFHFL
jgi:pleckstrin homology domain-containing family G member 5